MAKKGRSSARVQNVKLANFMKRSRKRTLRGVSKGDVRRLARRGGVSRISAMVYGEVKDILKLYLKSLVRDSILYCEYFKRKTVFPEDVIRALKCRGQRLYGFDEKPFHFSRRSSARMTDDATSTNSELCVRSSSRAAPNSSCRTTSSTRNPDLDNSQSRKSSLRNTKENTREIDDSDSTVDNLEIFRNSSRTAPDSNNSVQIIDSDDDFILPTKRK